MSEQLLNVFKICLLAVLYLFFARVLRAVWAELKEPKPAVVPGSVPAGPVPAPVPAPKQPARSHLVVVAPDEQRGRSYELLDELTVGRAAGCHIALEDRFVSQLHARMADVFLARDRLLDRPVAIKVLFPDLAGDPAFVEQLVRAAALLVGRNDDEM